MTGQHLRAALSIALRNELPSRGKQDDDHLTRAETKAIFIGFIDMVLDQIFDEPGRHEVPRMPRKRKILNRAK